MLTMPKSIKRLLTMRLKLLSAFDHARYTIFAENTS
jgi:hypothetical protein